MEKRRSNKRYSDEFKRDAVALVRSSGRTAAEVSIELGISDTALGNWLHDPAFNGDAEAAQAAAGAAAEKAEEARLRRRVRELEEEIEILKRFTKYWVREGGK